MSSHIKHHACTGFQKERAAHEETLNTLKAGHEQTLSLKVGGYEAELKSIAIIGASQLCAQTFRSSSRYCKQRAWYKLSGDDYLLNSPPICPTVVRIRTR